MSAEVKYSLVGAAATNDDDDDGDSMYTICDNISTDIEIKNATDTCFANRICCIFVFKYKII